MKKIGIFLYNIGCSELFWTGVIFNSLFFRGSTALNCWNKGNINGFWFFLIIEIIATLLVIKSLKKYFWPVDEEIEEEEKD